MPRAEKMLSALPRNRRIWVAGHKGLVGSALLRHLNAMGCELPVCDRNQVDLRDQQATSSWLRRERPGVVVIAAATVGGIQVNRLSPADFLYDNLMIAANIIHAAAKCDVEKLLFLGSSCIYPRSADQPIVPESLLQGELEPTNEAYAIAKIAGIKLCQAYRAQHGCDFITAMPCNLYGPGDRFDPVRSHVIPAMLLKFHQARERNDPSVTVWGSGTPLREFLHVDDLASAVTVMLGSYSGSEPVNVGSGAEISIRDLSALIAGTVGYTGAIEFDASMPDGALRKILDSKFIRGLGWAPAVELREGLRSTYQWYRESGAGRAA